MRTDNQQSQLRSAKEMKELVRERTARLREEQRSARLRWVRLASVAASLGIIVGLGILLSHLTEDPASLEAGASSVQGMAVASMLGDNTLVGYIIMGILCFLLGCGVTILLYLIKRRKH